MSVTCSILDIFSYGLVFALVGLGVFLSKKVFNLVDLTCESSFALGGCIYGAMILTGANPLFALTMAMIFGYFSGMITASIMNHIKLNSIIASLLTVGCLQSFLLKLSTIKGFNRLLAGSLLGNLSSVDNFIISFLLVGLFSFMFYRLMNSEYGLAMRVFGNGPLVTESMGIDRTKTLSFGLGISNLLCALAGALIAQLSGQFSLSMGGGCLIFGLAAILIGEKLFGVGGFRKSILTTLGGAIVCQAGLQFITRKGLYGLGEEYNSIILASALMILLICRRIEDQGHNKENI